MPDAILLVERLDFFRDLDRIAIALVSTFDLVIKTKVALERTAALAWNALGADRNRLRFIDGGWPEVGDGR